MKLSVAVSMGLALFTEMAVADGGFFNSCKGNWFMRDNLMTAECKKANGQYLRTRQDMNLCLRNDNGVLKAANNGGFLTSCYNCAQGGPGLILAGAPPTSWLTCKCVTADKREILTQIDLNNVISNLDGYMWCSGHRSAPY